MRRYTRWGSEGLAGLAVTDPIDAARLAGADRPVDLARALFIDIETTEGGAIFLVGMGCLGADGRFEVVQHLARSPLAEVDLLLGVHTRLGRSAAIVSYNGRSFDLPELMARARRQGLAVKHPGAVHWDLLPTARRLFRETFPSRALLFLEGALLGIRRRLDVPSAEVPAHYRRFVATGDEALLAPVLAHNAADVLTMAALALRFVRHYRGEGLERATDRWSLGRIMEREGRLAEADRLFGQAWPDLGPARQLRLLPDWARVLRRMGQPERRRHLLEAMARAGGPVDPELLVAIAKDAEHRQRDLTRALEAARVARSLLCERAQLTSRPADPQQLRDIEHRIHRLTHRLSRPTPKPGRGA